MRVLVTGAAGFLGSHLCERLLQEGHEVIGMDNFLTGRPENLASFSTHPDFQFIRHDVSNYIFVPKPVDAVMHFASPASPNPTSPYGYTNLPIQTMKAGALGTHNTLGVALANQARYILASTSEVYGDPQVHPQTEAYFGHVNPIGDRSVYDEAKRFAEALTMAYHRFHEVNTGIVRIFNTYGPRMRIDDGRVIPSFLHKSMTGQDLVIFGQGEQTRSFCYVDDLIDGIYAFLLSDETGPMNLGNDVEFTILDLAKLVIRLTGSASEIVFDHEVNLGDDPLRRRPDLSLARSALDYAARVSLEEGLKKTIEHYTTVERLFD